MKENLEKFVLFLNKHYGITPNFLTYIRIFAAPWLALFVSKIIEDKNLTLAIVTLTLYVLVIVTDLLDGILARAISKDRQYDHAHGGMLDRLGDKIVIIFLLIPFGFNLFTFLIIVAESILAFQAIHSESHKKGATYAGKIKMFLQAFLVPLLILNMVLDSIPEIFVYAYIIITIIATYASVYSHYFNSEK